MPSNNNSNKNRNKSRYGVGRTAKSGAPFDLALPSGETCLVKRAAPEDLILGGVLDSLDTLTGLVSDLHIQRVLKGKAGRDVAEAKRRTAIIELIKDKTRWEGLMKLVDAVTVYCVVEPKVSPYPPEGEDRDPDALYADDVALFDKFAIMTAALSDSIDKVTAMEPFRDRPTADVGNLVASEGVQRETERVGGN